MITPVLAARDAAALLQNEDFLWLVAALVATLLVGALLFAWLDRWRKRQLSDTPKEDVELISSYRAMYERGELSKEQYDRIRQREAKRVHDKVIPKNATSTPPPKEPPAQPSAQEPDSPAPPS